MLWDKGVGIFVEAARKLKQKLDACFVLVGEPDSGNPGSIEEHQILNWQNEGVIEWWGWQSDMASVYQRCHIVALPTKYGEGVPTSLIEAAASGKPLIGSDTPGCRAIIKPGINGLLVLPDESESLISALEELIKKPNLRKRMGEESLKLFKEKFSHNIVNQATLNVYQNLLHNFNNL
jgi:glycosyltransferase involved in cell wall biosynthesis